MKEPDILAPVILFVYNRLNHTMRTIEALQNNIFAKQSELIVYSDAAKDDSLVQEVDDVRKYLRTISGFRQVNIIERETNMGLARSIIDGVTYQIGKYGQVIVLEDDLLTSSNFLCYMNQALEYYEKRQDIFAISGYTGLLPSLENLQEDTYLSYRPASWGWATWKDQWENIDWNVIDFEEFVNNRIAMKKFNRGGVDMTRMLRNYMEGKNNSWAIRWSYAMYKQNKYCIYPKVSKIQNIGFGPESTHCSNINIYQTILDNSKQCKFNFTNKNTPSIQLVKEFRYQFSYTNKLLKKMSGYIKKVLNEA